MTELVAKLAGSQHTVIAERYESAQALAQQIEHQFVLLKFTDTQGGTELGCQLNMDLTDLSDGNFESAKGTVRLVGDLTLDFQSVQLAVEIDLATLEGTGGITHS